MTDINFYKSVRDYLLTYLPKQRVCSKNTVASYRQAINGFINFMAKVKGCGISGVGFDDLNYKNVTLFLDETQSSGQNSPSTRNLRLYALRAFAKYTGAISPEYYYLYLELSNVPVQKEERRVVGHISEEAVKCILEQPDIKTKIGIRDRCFMILMYDIAARDREMLDLTVGSLSLLGAAPYVKVVGKGNRTRHVPIMGKTACHLLNYLKQFHTNTVHTDYLFYTVSHGRRNQMSDDNVSRFMKKYGRMAKTECAEVPDNIYPHLFRHARALHLYRNGMPLPILSEFLGHASLQSTQVYAYADTEMKRRAIEKARGGLHLPEDLPGWQTDDDVIRKLYGL